MTDKLEARLNKVVVNEKMTLPLVKIVKCETIDEAAPYLHRALAHGVPLSQITWWRPSGWSNPITVFPADHGGMSSVSPQTNIGVLWFPPDGTMEVAIYGCKHEIKSVQRGRCYYEYHCVLCDYNYVIDSGD